MEITGFNGLDTKDACSYLILSTSVKRDVSQFDCVCQESTAAGCIKDGWCPIYAQRMMRLKEYSEYRKSHCETCGGKDQCNSNIDDVESCMDNDEIRKFEEEEIKAKLMEVQEQTLEAAKNQEDIEAEELKKSLDESDAHMEYCETMKNLGDPAYQD